MEQSETRYQLKSHIDGSYRESELYLYKIFIDDHLFREHGKKNTLAMNQTGEKGHGKKSIHRSG